MDKTRIFQLKTCFDDIVHWISNEDESEQMEVWFARKLQEILGSTRWGNFAVAVNRAIESCKAQSVLVT
jgi:DNA-damage-inducible protein D